VIQPAILARLLDGHDVVGLLDHADHLAVPRGTGAVQAGVGVGDVIAHRAEAHVQFGVTNRIGERQRLLLSGAKNVKGEPLRGLGSDSGQVLELVDEALDRCGEVRHRANSRVAYGSGKALSRSVSET